MLASPLHTMCPFMIFEGCLNSNSECCSSKRAGYQLSHPSIYLTTHPPCLATRPPTLPPIPLLCHPYPDLAFSHPSPLLGHPSPYLATHPRIPLLSHPSPYLATHPPSWPPLPEKDIQNSLFPDDTSEESGGQGTRGTTSPSTVKIETNLAIVSLIHLRLVLWTRNDVIPSYQSGPKK